MLILFHENSKEYTMAFLRVGDLQYSVVIL